MTTENQLLRKVRQGLTMTERAAIAATLRNDELMHLVCELADFDVGDPMHNPHDSAAMRERFGITVEVHHKTVLAFNDLVCSALPIGEVFRPPAIARRAACIAVASMSKRFGPLPIKQNGQKP